MGLTVLTAGAPVAAAGAETGRRDVPGNPAPPAPAEPAPETGAAAVVVRDSLRGFFPPVLTREMVEEHPNFAGHAIDFGGRTYRVAVLGLGDGVPYTQIAVYAPAGDGDFHLSLFAQSWAAGWIKPSLDEKTGILELREHANSELRGQVVLSCNLRTIGTQVSTGGP